MKTVAISLFLLFSLFSHEKGGTRANSTIILPPGITIVSTPIVLKSGDRLIGNNSTIRLADHANCPVIVLGSTEDFPSPSYNIYVSNINIDGNKENQDWESNEMGSAHLRNNGISIRNCHGVVLHKVNAHNARSGGIVIERGSSHVSIVDSSMSGNFFDGLAAYESTKVFISKVELNNNLFAGLSIDLNFNYNTLRNLQISGNGREGIFIRHSNGNQFSNIYLSNNGGAGIFMAESEMYKSGANNNIFSEIYFSGNSIPVQINHETCTGNVWRTYDIENLIDMVKLTSIK